MDIKGSKAIIVGGASGMALATAEAFVAKGGKVAILDLEKSKGAEVAQRLNGTFHPCNVMDYEGTEKVIGDAVKALGGLHFVVNTAGGARAQRTLAKDGTMHPLDGFRQIIDLNLVATFNVNRIGAKHMSTNEPNADGERGVMINTASIAAFEGQIGQVAYTAAKGGIAAMTLTMARDLGALGIRVMTIAPSLFATGLTAGIPTEAEQAVDERRGVPATDGQTPRVRADGARDFRKPDAERQHDPHRRRPAFRPALR